MSSSTRTYNGTGLTTSGWRANAEPANPGHDTDDMTAECGHSLGPDGKVVLEAETGEGFPGRKGAAVPNASISHVSNPAAVRSLPSDHMTNQNRLHVRRPGQAPARPHGSAGETRGRGASRGR